MWFARPARSASVRVSLLDRLLESATEMGARTVLLDTAGFMSAAHGLYRSRGFAERPPYEGTEIPASLHEHWLFFERELGARAYGAR
jgi:ribosomal protein S18 acetylase RimI-like enzyme